MARYYHEDRPDYDGLFRRPDNPSKTYMLLRPEFWRGQQHGGRHDAIHARHMRPRCDIISTGCCPDYPRLCDDFIADGSHRPQKSRGFSEEPCALRWSLQSLDLLKADIAADALPSLGDG